MGVIPARDSTNVDFPLPVYPTIAVNDRAEKEMETFRKRMLVSSYPIDTESRTSELEPCVNHERGSSKIGLLRRL